MTDHAPAKATFSKASPLKVPPGRGSPGHGNFPGLARVQHALHETSEAPIQRKCEGCEAEDALEANPCIQPKLEVGPANDRFEQEADQTAERVMRMAEPALFKSQISAGTNQVQAKGAKGGAVPSKVANSIKGLRGGGTPLPKTSKAFFEPRFGQDFSKVRLHTDAKASQMADSIQAKAFTLGNDIAFAKGAYNPESQSGKQLLAHELTHTVQQGGVRNQVPTIRRQEKKPPEMKAKDAPNSSKEEISPRPIFQDVWKAFHQKGLTGNKHIADLIGGKVEINANLPAESGGWSNFCVVRISHALNKGGQEIPFIKRKTVSGAKGKWHLFRVTDLNDYLIVQWGAPDVFTEGERGKLDSSTVKGKQGILMLNTLGAWQGATGHFTLWDGTKTIDKTEKYFKSSIGLKLWVLP
ncbi:MAG: T6SS effector amidase Tae4 family protein [Sphingomonadales bacterium]